MTKTKEQQIEDALWYLERPGQAVGDEEKAINILASIARGKKGGAKLVKDIRESKPTLDLSTVPWSSLYGLELAIVIGHEPGAGAEGERVWNKKTAAFMKRILERHGAKVIIFEHKWRAYTRRQNVTMARIEAVLPDCFIVWELHYDGYKPRPEASGHHFKYRGAKMLAVYTQQGFSNQYPQSKARNSYGHGAGLHHCTSGDGAGFLQKAPGWAILTEPFFITNPAEKAFFKDKHEDIAMIYCIAAARFAKLKGK